MGATWSNPWWANVDTKLVWRERFVWWPKRSDRSGQRIWLCKAWRGTRSITGPGTPVEIEQWLTEKEYLIHCLSQ